MSAISAYRQEISGMPPGDAVDYLLEVIAGLVDGRDDWVLPGASLSPQERVLLRALADRSPRILTRDAAMVAIMADRPGEDEPDPRLIYVKISHLRRKLSGAGLPVRILTSHGTGWSVEVAQGFVWPWRVSA